MQRQTEIKNGAAAASYQLMLSRALYPTPSQESTPRENHVNYGVPPSAHVACKCKRSIKSGEWQGAFEAPGKLVVSVNGT